MITTAGQLRLLGLIAEGKANKEIASEFCVSPRTVEKRISSLYLKIGASNRAHAVAIAFRRGWLK